MGGNIGFLLEHLFKVEEVNFVLPMRRNIVMHEVAGCLLVLGEGMIVTEQGMFKVFGGVEDSWRVERLVGKVSGRCLDGTRGERLVITVNVSGLNLGRRYHVGHDPF